MTPVIIDIVLVALLLGLTVLGWRRGLIRALAGLLIVVLALTGAGIGGRMLAEPVTDLLMPVLGEQISEKVEELLPASVANVDWSEAAVVERAREELGRFMEELGLDTQQGEALLEKLRHSGEEAAMVIARESVESVVLVSLYILLFLVLLLVLHFLFGTLDLVAKLPLLHGLNSLGGAVIGLIEAVVLAYLLIALFPRLDLALAPDLIAQTKILQFFVTHKPLGLLSLLIQV